MNYETHKLTDVRYKCNRSLLFKINDFPHLATVYILIIYEWITDLNLFYLFISLNLKSVTFHYFDYLIKLATGETASAYDPVVQNLGGGGGGVHLESFGSQENSDII